MSDNTSFVLQRIGEVSYEQRPIPEIRHDEVLVEVKKTGELPTFAVCDDINIRSSPGICGSDVHYLVHGRIGDFVVKNPMVRIVSV
ncbi:hypothetical protein BC834DRAFT_968573 [Gloeopeniophorella convolvens]|nr:hypothetical protein BC834DRAFT_968573 [Gloeopeniophorella convolvens]